MPTPFLQHSMPFLLPCPLSWVPVVAFLLYVLCCLVMLMSLFTSININKSLAVFSFLDIFQNFVSLMQKFYAHWNLVLRIAYEEKKNKNSNTLNPQTTKCLLFLYRKASASETLNWGSFISYRIWIFQSGMINMFWETVPESTVTTIRINYPP